MGYGDMGYGDMGRWAPRPRGCAAAIDGGANSDPGQTRIEQERHCALLVFVAWLRVSIEFGRGRRGRGAFVRSLVTGATSHLRSPTLRSLLVLISLSGACYAADGALESASELMRKGEPARAFALLEPLEPQRAGEPAFDYMLGIAALDANKPTRAVFALERVVALQPDNQLARAELARAYLALHELDRSREEFERVASGPLPDAARQAVDRYLSLFRRQPGVAKRVTGYTAFTFGYDSNVNSATDRGALVLPLLGPDPVVLRESGVEQEDAFGVLEVAVDIRLAMTPRFEWFAGGFAKGHWPRRETIFRTSTFQGYAGFASQVGNNRFSLSTLAEHFQLNADAFRNAYGMSGQWRYTFSSGTSASAYVQATRLSYPQQRVRNANRIGAGLSIAHTFATAFNPTVFGAVYGGTEAELASGAPHLGHDFVGLRAGVQAALSDRLLLSADASYEQRKYDGADPFFLRSRDDRRFGVSIGLRYAAAKSWSIGPRIEYSRSDSNIPLDDYRRTVASVEVRYEF